MFILLFTHSFYLVLFQVCIIRIQFVLLLGYKRLEYEISYQFNMKNMIYEANIIYETNMIHETNMMHLINMMYLKIFV